MKELPRPITIILLALGCLLLSMVVFELYRSRDSGPTGQYLDELDIQTSNPQPAGKNIAP